MGTPHPCWTCVRVGGGGSNNSAGITLSRSISLPDRKRYRTAAACARSWRRFVKVSLEIPSSLKGGWNLDEGQLDALLRCWRCVPYAKTVWPRDASARVPGTCRRGSRRVVNHFEAWPPSRALPFPSQTLSLSPIHGTPPTTSMSSLPSLALWLTCSNIPNPLPCLNAWPSGQSRSHLGGVPMLSYPSVGLLMATFVR
jgi:hypothetical protein